MFHWPLKGKYSVPSCLKEAKRKVVDHLSLSLCVCVSPRFIFRSIWQIFTKLGVDIIQFGNTRTALLYFSLQLVTKWRMREIVRRHERHLLLGAEIKRANTSRKNSNFC
jgi:hypothetical protein